MTAPARVLAFPEEPDLDFTDPLERAIKHAEFAAAEFARAADWADNTNRIAAVYVRLRERIETLTAVQQHVGDRWDVILGDKS